jgi:hypothetical protein
MPYIDTVLHYLRLIRLFKTMCLLCSLHLVSTDLPIWPLPHSHGVRYTQGIFKPKLSLTDLSICMFFFRAIWTVVILYLARSLLILLEIKCSGSSFAWI